jgi:hypothetical protein
MRETRSERVGWSKKRAGLVKSFSLRDTVGWDSREVQKNGLDNNAASLGMAMITEEYVHGTELRDERDQEQS